MKRLLFALLLLPSIAFAQTPQILTVDAAPGVTACEIEQSLDNGLTWAPMTPKATPAGTPAQCTVSIVPPTGRSLYRWAYYAGATRILRTDAGVYLCAGLPDCPASPTNVGVK